MKQYTAEIPTLDKEVSVHAEHAGAARSIVAGDHDVEPYKVNVK